MNTVIIIISVIVAAIFGVVSNIVADLVSPYLEKRVKFTFSLFLGLLVLSILLVLFSSNLESSQATVGSQQAEIESVTLSPSIEEPTSALIANTPTNTPAPIPTETITPTPTNTATPTPTSIVTPAPTATPTSNVFPDSTTVRWDALLQSSPWDLIPESQELSLNVVAMDDKRLTLNDAFPGSEFDAIKSQWTVGAQRRYYFSETALCDSTGLLSISVINNLFTNEEAAVSYLNTTYEDHVFENAIPNPIPDAGHGGYIFFVDTLSACEGAQDRRGLALFFRGFNVVTNIIVVSVAGSIPGSELENIAMEIQRLVEDKILSKIES